MAGQSEQMASGAGSGTTPAAPMLPEAATMVTVAFPADVVESVTSHAPPPIVGVQATSAFALPAKQRLRDHAGREYRRW